MSQIPIMAKHHVSVVGMDDYNNKAIGMYLYDGRVGNDHVKLQANPNYWGGKPAIETLVFKPPGLQCGLWLWKRRSALCRSPDGRGLC